MLSAFAPYWRILQTFVFCGSGVVGPTEPVNWAQTPAETTRDARRSALAMIILSKIGKGKEWTAQAR